MAVVVFAYTLSIHQGLKEYTKVPMKNYANGLKTKIYSVTEPLDPLAPNGTITFISVSVAKTIVALVPVNETSKMLVSLLKFLPLMMTVSPI